MAYSQTIDDVSEHLKYYNVAKKIWNIIKNLSQ